MKLTRSQRHKYYKTALAIVKKQRLKDMAVCLTLDFLTKGNYWWSLGRLFPEFFKKRPAGASGLWWSNTPNGKAARLSALKKCIKETAPKKRTLCKPITL